jgi:hypothetical protein
MVIVRKNNLLLWSVTIIVSALAVALAWRQSYQPISAALSVPSSPGLDGTEIRAAYKIPADRLVCVVARSKTPGGESLDPHVYIVRFRTADWAGWRDPALLQPPGDQVLNLNAEMPDRAAEEEGAPARERAARDFYRYSPSCYSHPSLKEALQKVGYDRNPWPIKG